MRAQSNWPRWSLNSIDSSCCLSTMSSPPSGTSLPSLCSSQCPDRPITSERNELMIMCSHASSDYEAVFKREARICHEKEKYRHVGSEYFTFAFISKKRYLVYDVVKPSGSGVENASDCHYKPVHAWEQKSLFALGNRNDCYAKRTS